MAHIALYVFIILFVYTPSTGLCPLMVDIFSFSLVITIFVVPTMVPIPRECLFDTVLLLLKTALKLQLNIALI